jgi:hypothetical protein
MSKPITNRRRAPFKFPRRPWTTGEHVLLKTLFYEGLSCTEISLKMQRAPGAVWQRQKVLGLTGTKCKRWSPGQRKLVESELNRLAEHLAQRMGRTQTAVMAELTRAAFRSSKRRKTLKLDLALSDSAA